jgi:class 3 adenylate cyclase
LVAPSAARRAGSALGDSIAAAPGEGEYGFQGTRVNGWAYGVTVTFSSRLESAAASGTFELWIETVDECAGTYDGSFVVESFSAS